MDDKYAGLSWAERMKEVRKDLGRPLTLEELMDAGGHYRSADDPRGRQHAAGAGKTEVVQREE